MRVRNESTKQQDFKKAYRERNQTLV
uniref:Uncharacterized protein n=1 Tax=Anguilla anguilla TaxID=7936 RepID=A0A0E9S134_ANGAN